MKNEMLIHCIKAINYRFTKAIAVSKDNFGNYKISSHTRSSTEIINHMFDLAIKTKTMIIEGHFNCPSPEMLDFTGESKRFIAALQELQSAMNDREIDIEVSKKLLQGPILDIA